MNRNDMEKIASETTHPLYSMANIVIKALDMLPQDLDFRIEVFLKKNYNIDKIDIYRENSYDLVAKITNNKGLVLQYKKKKYPLE